MSHKVEIVEINGDTQYPKVVHWINNEEGSSDFGEQIGEQIVEDLKKIDLDGFNYYTYIADVKSRGNQPYSISDISKIELKQARTCKSCSFFRGEFGDKYLCKRPTFDTYLNNCFVSKKELDGLDFCVDYKYDYSKAEKSSKKTFCFNQPFKDIWE